MSRIRKIVRIERHEDHLKVLVQLDDGMEATVYVGGNCETFFHNGQVRAFVKKSI